MLVQTPATPGINWPKEHGGRGATPTEHLIFLEESERAGAPYVGVNFVGLLHAGPTLIAEASDEVQRGPPAARSCGATRSGARVSPSPARGPTSRRCGAVRYATVTTTS